VEVADGKQLAAAPLKVLSSYAMTTREHANGGTALADKY